MITPRAVFITGSVISYYFMSRHSAIAAAVFCPLLGAVITFFTALIIAFLNKYNPRKMFKHHIKPASGEVFQVYARDV
jgi:mannitol-specific phosphotransferase system IIBC component